MGKYGHIYADTVFEGLQKLDFNPQCVLNGLHETASASYFDGVTNGFYVGAATGVAITGIAVVCAIVQKNKEDKKKKEES